MIDDPTWYPPILTPTRLVYTVKVSDLDSSTPLLEYYRVHYGMLSVAELISDCLAGLSNLTPVIDAPLTIFLSVHKDETHPRASGGETGH